MEGLCIIENDYSMSGNMRYFFVLNETKHLHTYILMDTNTHTHKLIFKLKFMKEKNI